MYISADHHECTPTLFPKPHTLTALLLSLVLLVALLLYLPSSFTPPQQGLIAVTCFFLLYSAFQFRDTIFQRPHPVLWRVVKGISLLYLLTLIYLLFQPISYSRELMKYTDPSVGVPLEERSYATDCRIYTPNHPDGPFANVWATINDEFVLAHVIGWWAKMIMFRDFWLANLLSVLFEFTEYSFQHVLENFKECWFDHWIIDVLVCNLIGIWLGSITCEYLSFPRQNWFKQYAEVSSPKKVINQLGPFSFKVFKWPVFTSPLRFFSMSLLLVIALLIEINCFFLKTVLWLPPMSPFNTVRLLFWWLWGTPGLAEFYQFLINPNHRLGDQAWISFALAFVECLFWVVHGGYLFKRVHTPTYIPLLWIGGWLLCLGFAVSKWVQKGGQKDIEVTQVKEIPQDKENLPEPFVKKDKIPRTPLIHS
ncbi:hypothetical protein P9112_002878 [Eukaryota sp. TZLM1-RC]